MPEPARVRQTRTAYDTVAEDYARLLSDALAASPYDRAVLTAFAELVRSDGGGPVVEVGCGPGRIAAFLADLGLDVSGVDLSPAMVAVARRTFPRLRFEVGSMIALQPAGTGLNEVWWADATLAGLVAWYSIIHIPPAEVGQLCARFASWLRPGGRFVLAFQVGDEPRHIQHAYGHTVSVDAFRWRPERLAGLLNGAGMSVEATLVRAAEGEETTEQAYLIGRRVGPGGEP